MDPLSRGKSGVIGAIELTSTVQTSSLFDDMSRSAAHQTFDRHIGVIPPVSTGKRPEELDTFRCVSVQFHKRN